MEQVKYPQIGVRVDPAFRTEIKAAADRHHEGSESAVLREGARLYVAMRRKFGVQYEPIVSGLVGDPANESAA